MQYEYEMFFDDTSPVSIHGWWPIATDRIKDQSKIQEYIDKGILRRIDMKEQDAAHSFEDREILTPELKDDIRSKSLRYVAGKIQLWSLNTRDISLIKHAFQDIYLDLVHPKEVELTRLRSELQQKDEVMENIKVEYRNKGIDVCRYAAALWSNENGKDS